MSRSSAAWGWLACSTHLRRRGRWHRATASTVLASVHLAGHELVFLLLPQLEPALLPRDSGAHEEATHAPVERAWHSRPRRDEHREHDAADGAAGQDGLAEARHLVQLAKVGGLDAAHGGFQQTAFSAAGDRGAWCAARWWRQRCVVVELGRQVLKELGLFLLGCSRGLRRRGRGGRRKRPNHYYVIKKWMRCVGCV